MAILRGVGLAHVTTGDDRVVFAIPTDLAVADVSVPVDVDPAQREGRSMIHRP